MKLNVIIAKLKAELNDVPHSISDEAAYEIAARNEGIELAVELLLELLVDIRDVIVKKETHNDGSS